MTGAESITVIEYGFIALAALATSTIGGVTGYGSGLLMPLILAPIIGPEVVVPVLGVAALFNNGSRVVAFWRVLDMRRALIVGLSAAPTCALSAYFYTFLSGPMVSLVLGLVLVALVPARRAFARIEKRLSDPMLVLSGVGYGALVGGTSGTGVLLIAILLAAGLQARAVIATDAATTLLIGIVKTLVFQSAGALPPSAWVVALVIGVAVVPGAFIARRLSEGLDAKSHAAILDGVVVFGGLMLAAQGVRALAF